MTPEVRDAAACLLLAAADWWDATPSDRRSAKGAARAIGISRSPAGLVIADLLGRLSTDVWWVAENIWWREAAALLLDGWEPGDEFVSRGLFA